MRDVTESVAMDNWIERTFADSENVTRFKERERELSDDGRCLN